MAQDAITATTDEHTVTMQALMEENTRLRTEIATIREVNQDLTRQLRGYKEIIGKIKARFQTSGQNGIRRNSMVGGARHSRTINAVGSDRSSRFFNPKSSGSGNSKATDQDETATDTTWMRGNWLSESANKRYLGGAEELFAQSEYELALMALRKLLAGREIPIKVRIEAKLLMSVILRTRNDLPQALAQAEDALQVAHSTQEIALASKAQFHRGLCFYHIEQYAEASWCFSLAASAKNHVEEIKLWEEMAEESRLRLPANDPGRYIAIGLKEIPSATTVEQTPSAQTFEETRSARTFEEFPATPTSAMRRLA